MLHYCVAFCRTKGYCKTSRTTRILKAFKYLCEITTGFSSGRSEHISVGKNNRCERNAIGNLKTYVFLSKWIISIANYFACTIYYTFGGWYYVIYDLIFNSVFEICSRSNKNLEILCILSLYKQHCQNTVQKVHSIIKKLRNCKWWANPTVLLTSTKALCFSTGDMLSCLEPCQKSWCGAELLQAA